MWGGVRLRGAEEEGEGGKIPEENRQDAEVQGRLTWPPFSTRPR